MTATSELHARMRENSGGLVITVGGEPFDGAETSDLTAPTLLVAPLRDALKKISSDGLVEEHLDRESCWQVVAIYLDERTSHVLASEEVQIEQIHQRVVELGSGWKARPIEDVS